MKIIFPSLRLTPPAISFVRGAFTLCLLAFTLVANSQTGLKYVPADAHVVMNLDLKNLDKKVNLDELRMYAFYRDMMREMRSAASDENQSAYYEEFMQAPENLGYNLMEPVYLFVKKEGTRTYFTLVTQLTDRAKFEEGMKKFAPEKFPEYVEEKDGFMLFQDGGDTYAWNHEVTISVWVQTAYDYGLYDNWNFDENNEWNWGDSTTWNFEENMEWNWGDSATWNFEENIEWNWEENGSNADTIYEERPEFFHFYPDSLYEEIYVPEYEDVEGDTLDWEWPEYDYDAYNWNDPEELEAAVEWAAKVMERRFLRPVSANEKYREATRQRRSDFHLWMDYSFFMESIGSQSTYGLVPGGGGPAAMSMMKDVLGIFYADTYLSMGLNFENGKMAIEYDLFFNDEMKRLYKGIYDVKFNKKFLRYVKESDQFFGYYYINYNVKNAIKEGKSLMYKLLEATPQYGAMAADAMRILGIFIDEEAIGNLLRGDMFVSFSGLQTVPVQTTSWEFDEDFNFSPKDTIVLKTFPVFTGMLSYGNEKDIMKFVNLGLNSQVLTKVGGYYKFEIPGEGFDVFMAMKKGVLIFTNDRDLVAKRLDTGYPRSERLSKKHRKALCDNTASIFWDIPKTIRAASGGAAPAVAGPMAYIDMLGKEFVSMEMTSSKKVDDRVRSRIDLNFRNKNMNSLRQFFNFVNDVYLEVIGGAKI